MWRRHRGFVAGGSAWIARLEKHPQLNGLEIALREWDPYVSKWVCVFPDRSERTVAEKNLTLDDP